MNNEQLQIEFKRNDGFWVRIKDLNMDERTNCLAKLIIDKENNLIIHTLLENAPAINIYNSEDFTFYSSDDGVILKVEGKGDIYDYWDLDNPESAEDFTKRYFQVWGLSKMEYEEYQNSEDKDISELMILRMKKREEIITEEEQELYRKILGLDNLEEIL